MAAPTYAHRRYGGGRGVDEQQREQQTLPRRASPAAVPLCLHASPCPAAALGTPVHAIALQDLVAAGGAARWEAKHSRH